MSTLSLQLIEENKRTKDTFLDLGNCGLTELPDELFECTWLESLNLAESYFDESGLLNLLSLKEKVDIDAFEIESANKDPKNTFSSLQVEHLEKLQALRKIYLYNTGIADISFCKKLIDVEVLDLRNNSITDIAPLENLTSLRCLIIECDSITDVHFVEKMVNLRILGLEGNSITDVSSLSGLIYLKVLALHVNSISNITSLAGLLNLSLLYLASHSITDLSPLAGLSNLRFLDLESDSVTDPSAIGKLVNLERLNVSNKEIIKPDVIENLIHLQELNLGGCKTDDIAALGKLTGLEKLDLYHNEITDITALRNLRNLRELDLQYNKITDLSALSELLNLEKLELNHNEITTITALKNLTRLRILNLQYNKITDLTGLEQLGNIEKLILRDNEITNTTALRNFKSQKELDLRHNKIDDIAGLRQLVTLEKLNLSYNRITDLTALRDLINLRALDLSFNKIIDLTGLEKLVDIETLTLTNNEITSTVALAGFNNQKALDLKNNKINDLTGLRQLTNLENLNLYDNQVTDLIPLQDLTNLIELNLSFNDIKQLTGLEKLVNVERLNLYYNKISDLSALENLTKLKELNLNDNEFTDITVIGNLSKLETLALSHYHGEHLAPLLYLASLKSLNLSGCRINDVSALKNLVKLEKLELDYSQIPDLTALKNLPNLKYLDLSTHRIKDPSALGDLAGIEILNLHKSEVADLAILQNLIRVKELDLSDNHISDITVLEKLTSLQELNLTNNRITHFDEKLLNALTSLEKLKLAGNPIQNIPTEIYDQANCLKDLTNYFKDSNKSSKPVYESKLILIGNGRVGKTCLVKRLLDNTYDPYEPSTHGIQLRHWQLSDLAADKGLDKIQVNIWDFGGQDIYHATHRLFLKTKAVFILVWDKQFEKEQDQTEDVGGKKIKYKNHPLLYWLSYIKAQSNNSPVVVVQSKMARDGKAEPLLSNEERNEYNVWKTISIESSRTSANGFKALGESLEEIVAGQIEKSCTETPTAWFQVREKIAMLQQKGIRQISLSEFDEICKEAELDESSTQTVLTYLHNIGVVFYKQGLFNNQIVIDQKWAIEAVYTLFDRRGFFVRLHNIGEFSREDLQEVWKNYSLEEQELFVSFMKGCEICFEVDEQENRSRQVPFEKKKFISPQLLPEEKPKSIAFAFEGNEGIYFKFQHRFLHAAVIQRFIVRVGFLAGIRDMWKDGILIRTDEGIALIEAVPPKNLVLIRIKGARYNILLEKIRYELKAINHDEEGVAESVSLDGETFVLLKQLVDRPVRNQEIQAENGTWVKFEDYDQFFSHPESAKFDRLKDARVESIKAYAPKIYFSYAWGEEREKIVDELYYSLLQNGYTVIRDKVDLGYKGLISEFMEDMGKADFVVVAISDKYLKSDHCMYELYELYRNSRLEKKELLKRIYPVRVESINLNDTKVLKEYFEHWKGKEIEWKQLVNEYGMDQKKHRAVENIMLALRDLLPFLNDINLSTKEELSKNNFEKFKQEIKERMKSFVNFML